MNKKYILPKVETLSSLALKDFMGHNQSGYFTANVTRSSGDFAGSIPSDLGGGSVETNGSQVTLRYKPGEVEFVVHGTLSGNQITLPSQSIPDAAFPTGSGNCSYQNATVQGSCTVLNENQLDCVIDVQGDTSCNGASSTHVEFVMQK